MLRIPLFISTACLTIFVGSVCAQEVELIPGSFEAIEASVAASQNRFEPSKPAQSMWTAPALPSDSPQSAAPLRSPQPTPVLPATRDSQPNPIVSPNSDSGGDDESRSLGNLEAPVPASPVASVSDRRPPTTAFSGSIDRSKFMPPPAVDNRKIDRQRLQPYFDRAAQYQDLESQQNTGRLAFNTWWANDIENPIGLEKSHQRISLDTAIAECLIHSPQIQITAADPSIQQTLLVEEAAKFDWTAFWETKYDSLNDPVGNTLTTGNNENRFRQKEWYSQGGVRKRNSYGGELELSQRLGYLDNNSRFLVPPDQGSARLSLNYRQPLWKGRGQYVAESLILLAKIDLQLANDQFRNSLQDHLVAVAEAYWELVRARSELVQRLRLFSRAEQVLVRLKGRGEVDALDRQIFRAKSAVESRRAEIARAVTSIKNAQSQLRLLVNSPDLIQRVNAELTPVNTSIGDMPPVDLADAIATAMIHRPDIAQALRQLRSANVRLGVSKNEVLPKLDLLIGTYVAGLDDESGMLRSWANQFQEGGPGFNIGLEFEVPFGNRAAQARQQRRQWEQHQALQQFRLTVESALNEVEIAVREVNTTRQEMTGRFQSMSAAETERAYLVDRWQTLPGIDDSVTLLLENLLDSQERLANEESSFTRAQFNYAIATVRLKQAMGTLFQVDAP